MTQPELGVATHVLVLTNTGYEYFLYCSSSSNINMLFKVFLLISS